MSNPIVDAFVYIVGGLVLAFSVPPLLKLLAERFLEWLDDRTGFMLKLRRRHARKLQERERKRH
jgi:hypothetical protein